jgi:hypothetical protein
MSMKPGASTSPSASTMRRALGRPPISVIRPPSTATSARKPGPPPPSTTVAPRNTTPI